jgi:hypothetical protein
MPKQRSSSAETLAQLIADVAGERGSGLTYAQLSDRSVDPDSGYKPSANLLNRIALGVAVKINPPLIRAITAGLGLPASRVEAAAHRQFIGPYVAVDPGLGGGHDDEVIRAATRDGATPPAGGGVEEFVRTSREEDSSDQR